MIRGAGWIPVVIGCLVLVECGASSSSRSGSGTRNEGGTSTGGDSGGSLATGGANAATGGATSTGGSTSTGGFGGSTSTGGSTSGGSTSGGGAGEGGDGGDDCDGAIYMGPCATDGSSCGSCTDICSFCNVLICQSGRWERRETGPAPCFGCGNELRCPMGEAFCRVEEGAAYVESCIPVPPSCETNVTCACLAPLHPDYDCSGETGSVTLVRGGG